MSKYEWGTAKEVKSCGHFKVGMIVNLNNTTAQLKITKIVKYYHKNDMTPFYDYWGELIRVGNTTHKLNAIYGLPVGAFSKP